MPLSPPPLLLVHMSKYFISLIPLLGMILSSCSDLNVTAGIGDEMDEQDFAEIQLKAKNGDVESQYMLGTIYLEGSGVPQDINAALLWLSKAAKSNHAQAQYHIGEIFENPGMNMRTIALLPNGTSSQLTMGMLLHKVKLGIFM